MKKLSIFFLSTVALALFSPFASAQTTQHFSETYNELLKQRTFYGHPTTSWDSLRCAWYGECAPANPISGGPRSTCPLNKRMFGWHSIGTSSSSYVWPSISDISYFSYDVNPATGNANNSTQIANWSTDAVVVAAHNNGVNVNLCVTLFNNTNEFSTFFGNSSAQTTLINNLVNAVIAANAKGVNIDFEGGGLSVTYNSQFISFMSSLSTQLHNSVPNSELSIDLSGSYAAYSGLLNQLNPYVDLFILMGYDYYWGGQHYPGPVGPLYQFPAATGDPNGHGSVSNDLNYILKVISPNKVILAMPYYGRRWGATNGCTIPGIGNAASISTQTYTQYKQNSNGYYSNPLRDSYTFNAYNCFTDASSIPNQEFMDDVYSLQKKYEVIKERGIAGAAVWRLGYDAGYSDLWNLVNDNLSSCAVIPCSATIYDMGGPLGNYHNNENYTFTINPIGATSVTLSFVSFSLENGSDYLKIYNGPTTNSPLIANLTGTNIPSPITANSGVMTIQFSSNGTTTSTGYEANYACGTGASCTSPTNQANAISFSGISTNAMTINWANGNGSRRIVKINTVNSFTAPGAGYDPVANNSYSGSGEQVIYNGTGNSVTVTGLTSSTNYCFEIYEANCTGNSSLYNIATATNNPNCQTTTSSCTAPTVQVSNLSFSGIGANSMNVSWANGNGTKRIVKINTTGNFTAPTDGTDPTANNTYGGSGEQVIYNGSGNNVTVAGLISGNNYCFRAYEANCSGASSLYNPASSTNNPNCQSTSTTCQTPPIPIPNFGDLVCPGSALWTNYNNIYLYWTNSGSVFYDVEIREYPYDATDVVFSQTCISGTNITVNSPNIIPGKMYAWRVRATVDCNACNSAYSPLYYFHVGPSTSPNGSISVCNGTGTTLSTPVISVPSPGTVSYQWYKYLSGNYISVGGNSNTYFATTSGTYYVRNIYSGSTICSGVDTTAQSFNVYVNISTVPNAPTLTSNSPVCEGNALSLSAAAAGNSQYFWTGPNGFNSNNNNISIQTVSGAYAGTYYCYVITAGCQSPTATADVIINPAPSATFTYTAVGNVVTFSNTSTSATTFNWTFGDAQTSSQTSPSHTYSTSNNYNVCLTANSPGCNSASNCQLISLGSGNSSSTVATFAKLLNDTTSSHKYWYTRDVVQSPVDSGYICIGWYQNTANNSNNGVQYYKLDKNGNLVWVRSLPEYSSANILKIIKSQNGYLLSLHYNGPIVMEIDEQGNKLWAKKISNSYHDAISNTDYTFDISNFIKAGTDGYIGEGSYGYTQYLDNFGTPSSLNYHSGISLVKIDNSGNLLWQKQYQYGFETMYASFTYPAISVINLMEDSIGNFYLYGDKENDTGNPSSSYDGYLAKFDANGNHLWSKYYASNTNYMDIITSGTIDNNSDIVLTTYSSNNSTIHSGSITKINSSGSVISSKQGNAGNLFKTVSGNVSCILYGSSNHPNIVTLNSSLSITSQKEFLFPSPYSIKSTLDNRFIAVCGQYLLNSNTNDYRYNIFKVSYTDNSCLDTVNSNLSLSNLTFNLSSLSNTTVTPNVSISNFTVNPVVSYLRDTNICHVCNLTAAITPGGSTTFCSGGSVTLTTNAGMASYLWSNGQTTSSINATTAGSYSVAITDSYSCPATSQSLSVTVNPLPYADAGNDQTVCLGNSTSIGTFQISGNTYQWSPMVNLNNSLIATPTATPTETTIYNVTVTNSFACSATDQVSVIVDSLPIANAGNDKSICNGSSTIIGTSQISGNTYSWFPGTELSSSTNATPNASPSSTTTYNLTVNNSYGCSATDQVIITVNPTVIPSVNITANPSGTICLGTSVTFMATPGNGGTTPVYQWKLNGGNVGSNSPTYSSPSLVNGDIVTCDLTSNATCASPTTVTSGNISMAVNTTVTPSVIIAANPGGAICAGSSVTFTATPTNGGTTPAYQWKVNGGNVGANSPAYSSLTLVDGSVVTCVMTSNSGCANPTTDTSNAINMVVNPTITPSVSIVANPGGAICAGITVTFTATPDNGGTTPVYQWKLNGGNVGSNSPTYSSPSLVNGDIVTCELTSNATCASPAIVTSNGITTVVNPIVTPSVNITANPDGAICTGTPVTFTATPNNGGTTPVYQWKVNGGNVGSNSSSFFSSSLTNGDVVTCELTSNVNCASTATAVSNGISIVVNSAIAPAINITANPSGAACAGTTITFTATSTGGGTPAYQWKVNGGNMGANSAVFSSSAFANGDTVTCVLTSSLTCANPVIVVSSSLTLSINPAPQATITPSGLINICNGDSVELSASPGNPLYLWNTTATTQSIFAKFGGNYNVTVTNINNCSASSSPTTISVNPLPAVPIFNPSNPSGTNSVQVTANSNGCNTCNYNWSNGDTGTIGTFTSIGNYTVSVTATDSNGCSATGQVVVSVISNLQDINIFQLTITPNPSSGNFVIAFETDKPEKIQLKILDIVGQLIKEETLIKNAGKWTKEINLDNVAKGSYILQLGTEDHMLNRKIELN